MRPISKYFSRKHQDTFKAALPGLRKLVGITPFANHDQKYGAVGNTLRAYRNFSKPPSVVFRKWAEEVCGHRSTSEFASDLERHLASRAAFLRWHATLARGLQHVWRREQGRPL